MEVLEAEIGEGRGVSEALEDAVEVAGVAEVPEAERGTGLALEAQQARLPAHLQPVVVQGHQRPSPSASSALARALHGGAPRRPLALIADRGRDRPRIAPVGPRRRPRRRRRRDRQGSFSKPLERETKHWVFPSPRLQALGGLGAKLSHAVVTRIAVHLNYFFLYKGKNGFAFFFFLLLFILELHNHNSFIIR